MIYKLLIATSMFAAGSTAGFAQTNLQGTATNWGPASSSVRLRIDVSTNVVTAGSELKIGVHLWNSSTNAIAIYSSGEPVHDFGFVLIDSAGTNRDLLPKEPIRMVNGNYFAEIRPGAIIDVPISIATLNPGLEPGTYILVAKRSFVTRSNEPIGGRERHILESNQIQLQLR